MKSELGSLEGALSRAGARYRARQNPPGRRVISYRSAGYERYRETMLAALDVVEVNVERPSRWVRPLAGANLDPRTDWMIALIDAWAVAGEILSFYQDRIVNEGFLRTACEPFSLDQLLREIGVRRGGRPRSSGAPDKKVSPAAATPNVNIVSRAPAIPSQLRPPMPTVPTPGAATAVPLPAATNPNDAYEVLIDPGAAAITDMAFTVMPDRPNGGRALVRAGSAVRSHRADGGAPILFETSADLDARLEYNALAPALTPTEVEPVLLAASVGLELAGTSTRLKPGDAVLVLGERVPAGSPPNSEGTPAWLYGQLVTVESNPTLGNTLVTWTKPNDSRGGGLLNQAELGADRLERLRVFGFERLLAPFGESAKPLDKAPLATQISLSTGGGVARRSAETGTWTRLIEGLPPRSLSTVALGDDGTAWIGGGFGAAKVGAGGDDRWSIANVGLGNLEVGDFSLGTDGTLWLGTTTGQVFCASGAGGGWSGLVGSFTLVPDATKRLAPVKTSLPRSPITCVRPLAAPPAPPTAGASKPPATTSGAEPKPPGPAVLVGTGLGIFGNPLDGRGWFPVAATTGSLPSGPIVDLQMVPPDDANASDGGLAIGATASELVVFELAPLEPPSPIPSATTEAPASPPGAPSASPAHDRSPSKFPRLPGEIRKLRFVQTASDTTLLVLTSAGVYRWQPASPSALTTGEFIPLTAGLDPKRLLRDVAAVPSKARAKLGGVAVGNDGKDVWVLSDAPAWTWQPLAGFPGSETSDGDAPIEVATSVVVGANGDVLATAPLAFARAWPGFEVVRASDTNELSVDTLSRPFDLAPASWVVVVAGTTARVFSLTRAEVAYRDGESAFGDPGRVFRLIVEDFVPGASATFDPHQADVAVRSFELELAPRVSPDMRPVSGLAVVLAGLVEDLERELATATAHRGRLLAFTGQRPRLCVTLAGGLWQNAAANGSPGTWEELGFGFESVTAILSSADRLWAATSSGVRARASDGTWQDCSAWLASAGSLPNIFALAGAGATVLAATSAGLFRWNGPEASWTQVALNGADEPRCLAVMVTPEGTTSWVGTAGTGLWVSRAGGEFTNVEDAMALVGSPIRALAAVGELLVIGTADAVYRYDAAPETATPRFTSVAPLPTLSLAVWRNGVLCGTDDRGVFAIDDLAGSATTRAVGLTGLCVTALACAGDRCFAGTSGQGSYVSTDASVWTPAPIGVPATVRALAADAEGTVYAGADAAARLIDKAGATTAELSCSVALELPAPFALELTQGFVSERLQQAFARAKLTLAPDAGVTELVPGTRWLLSSLGTPAATVFVLFRAASGNVRVVQINTLPAVSGAWPDTAGDSVVSVELGDGNARGSLTLGPNQWLLCPPEPNDHAVSEVRRVASTRHDPEHGVTAVRLEKPLLHTYFRAGLGICANVIRASQGETVGGEILGDGNSGLANQRFHLRRAPLTFLPVPPPEFRRSTLSVRVGGVLWTEVTHLADAGPRDRVYCVAVDYEGRATLTFGDGVNGARLPTGTQNVVATYRVGLGAQGDVATGTLDVMLSPPPGIRSVTNPIPASRGVNPGDTDTLRRVFPQSARTGNRVVSLDDNAALASSFPGVRQAIVTPIKHPRGTLLQISVAFDPSVIKTDYAERCRALAAALRKAQAAPAPTVSVGVAEPAYFELALEVQARPGARHDEVASAVLDALDARWSPAAADIGTDIEASSIEALLQALPRVEGVKVTRLAANFELAVKGGRVLAARLARYDAEAGRCLPASLLALAPAAATRVTPSHGATKATYVRGGVTLALKGASS